MTKRKNAQLHVAEQHIIIISISILQIPLLHLFHVQEIKVSINVRCNQKLLET